MADRPPSATGAAGAERSRLTGVYADYADEAHRARWGDEQPGNRATIAERDAVAHHLLGEAWARRPATGRSLVVLDVGCGDGDHLARFLADAPAASPLASAARAVGVDLLADRLHAARASWGARFARGDGTALPLPDGAVDLVLAFTVLSSVLDPAVRRALAAEARRVLAPGGALVLYDMRVPSHRNRNVSPISGRSVADLFPGLHATRRSVTLLPPLARRLGPQTGRVYPVLSRIPLLHTHAVTVLTR